MHHFRNLIFFLSLLPLLGITSQAAPGSKYVNMSGKLFQKSEQAYLAITLKNEKKWHTYWKNPGDAGLPIKFDFRIDGRPVQFEELEWPLPKKYIEEGDILTYGYEGSQSFFFKLSPSQVQGARDYGLLAHATYLVCKDICIPGESSITMRASQNLSGASSELGEALESLPKKISSAPKELELFLTQGKEPDTLELQYTLKNAAPGEIDRSLNLIMPFNADLVSFKREKLYYDSERQTIYGVLGLEWDGKYEDPARPLPTDGKFVTPVKMRFLFRGTKDSRPVVFEKSFEQYSLGGQKAFAEFLNGLESLDEGEAPVKTSESSVLAALLFAFLGGLILNLMPCVLPVISLKLFGLIAHSDEKKAKILKHNLSYTAGIISTFWVLAAVVLGLKSAGETIGWGFQLQSPTFVFIMMAVIFVLALNMLGLFEFITPGGSRLGNAQMKKGMSADFINGVLATILSTPCSAPFLGTALTFAFTTSSFNIFLTLTFVGLGLAFPFIITGLFPRLISFLPRPGMWMEKLKNVLGLTLLLTFVWLYDILSSQIDYAFAGIYINTIFTMIFFAFFFRKFISKNIFINALIFLIPLALSFTMANNGGLKAGDFGTSSSQHGSLDWKKWSREAMKNSQGRYVFMDFTADWCLTCKVNEKLVLNTEAFEELVKEKDIELLLGDWTKRDDQITAFLREHDIVGVPAYFVQTPNGKVIKLGETISIDKIKKNME